MVTGYGRSGFAPKYPVTDEVAIRFGKLAGVSPTRARVLLYGPHRLNRSTALAIQAFLAAHEDQRLAHWLVEIDLAMTGLQRPALSDDLVTQEQMADADEDVAQVRWLLSRQPEDRLRFEHALEKALHRTRALLAALRAEREAATI